MFNFSGQDRTLMDRPCVVKILIVLFLLLFTVKMTFETHLKYRTVSSVPFSNVV